MENNRDGLLREASRTLHIVHDAMKKFYGTDNFNAVLDQMALSQVSVGEIDAQAKYIDAALAAPSPAAAGEWRPSGQDTMNALLAMCGVIANYERQGTLPHVMASLEHIRLCLRYLDGIVPATPTPAPSPTEKCPTCNSPDYPPMQFESEVQWCSDGWHDGIKATPSPAAPGYYEGLAAEVVESTLQASADDLDARIAHALRQAAAMQRELDKAISQEALANGALESLSRNHAKARHRLAALQRRINPDDPAAVERVRKTIWPYGKIWPYEDVTAKEVLKVILHD